MQMRRFEWQQWYMWSLALFLVIQVRRKGLLFTKM